MIKITASDNEIMYRAYEQTKNAGNERLDLNDVIPDEEIRPIAETLRGADIKKFTISVSQMNIAEILAAFSDLGIVIQGMIRIKKRYYAGDEAPVFLMKVNESNPSDKI